MDDTGERRQVSQPGIFTRSASAILSGGGVIAASTDVDAPNERSDPLLTRHQSRRQVNSAQVQDRLRREAVQNIMGRFTLPAVLLCSMIVMVISAGSILMFFFFVRALLATFFYQNLPCDRPLLKCYVFVSLGTGTFTSRISQAVVRRMQAERMSTRTVWLCSTLVAMVPGWITLVWGYSLIQKCETCQKTNPDLFYDLQSYIRFQILASITYLAVVVPMLAFAHRFLMMLQAISMGEGVKGCGDKIKDLPKIPNDSPELRDPDDNSLMECCICLTSFASQSVVRTPCGHYFHEKCLTQWCQAHVSCPLCKSLVADPENSDILGDDCNSDSHLTA